jgi:hypothetical protein
MVSIIHHINDDEDPAGVAKQFRDALPAGSHLAISHFFNPGVEDPAGAKHAAESERLFNETIGTGRWRTRDEITAYFGDWELLEPGVVSLPDWRVDPDDVSERGPACSSIACGVARKS